MGHCKSQNGTANVSDRLGVVRNHKYVDSICERNEDFPEPTLPRMLNYLDQQLMQFRF